MSPAASCELPDWIEAAGAIAQVVIAIVAVVFSIRAFFEAKKTGRDAIFLPSVVKSLMDIAAQARGVKAAHHGMFVKHASVEKKRDARSAWLRQREAVAVVLDELSELLPEIEPARLGWRAVQDVEDTFTTSDALKPPQSNAITHAQKKYEEAHSSFLKCLGGILRRLR